LKFISWRINGKNDQSLICGGKIVEFGIAGILLRLLVSVQGRSYHGD
jgi:hypothetical protein